MQKKKKKGTGEMDAQLRAQAALPKDPGLIPSTYVGAYSYLTSFPEDLIPPSGLHGHQAHIHTCKQSTHIKIK